MDFEETIIEGRKMISFRGFWYPVDEDDEDIYEERMDNGWRLGLIRGNWYPVAEVELKMFPFFDLSDAELCEIHDIWYDDLIEYENPLEYDDPYADEVYDMLLVE
jgi:hypothetical protein